MPLVDPGISVRSADDTGLGWSYEVECERARSCHGHTIGTAWVRRIIALRSAIPA